MLLDTIDRHTYVRQGLIPCPASRVVSVPATQQAYRRGALRWHPDKNQHNKGEAEARFVQLANAYEVLSNEAARRRYDAELGSAGEQPPGTTSTHTTFRSADDIFAEVFGDDDVFAEFFAASPFAGQGESADGRGDTQQPVTTASAGSHSWQRDASGRVVPRRTVTTTTVTKSTTTVGGRRTEFSEMHTTTDARGRRRVKKLSSHLDRQGREHSRAEVSDELGGHTRHMHRHMINGKWVGDDGVPLDREEL
jgi:DnaJ-class molecular chaperone